MKYITLIVTLFFALLIGFYAGKSVRFPDHTAVEKGDATFCELEENARFALCPETRMNHKNGVIFYFCGPSEKYEDELYVLALKKLPQDVEDELAETMTIMELDEFIVWPHCRMGAWRVFHIYKERDCEGDICEDSTTSGDDASPSIDGGIPEE